jgi:hypothetical protein
MGGGVYWNGWGVGEVWPRSLGSKETQCTAKPCWEVQEGYPSPAVGFRGTTPRKQFESLIEKSCILTHCLTRKRKLEKVWSYCINWHGVWEFGLLPISEWDCDTYFMEYWHLPHCYRAVGMDIENFSVHNSSPTDFWMQNSPTATADMQE